MGVGFAVGAGLGAANWAVNHRRENWVGHVVGGGIRGAITGALGFGVSKFAQMRLPIAHSHRLVKPTRLGRYFAARRQFSPSRLWSVGRLLKWRKQTRFIRKYRR